MKSKLFRVIVIVVIAFMVIMAGWYILFVHFGKGPSFPFVQYQKMDVGEGEPAMVAENQLMTMTDTEEDPFEVIARGQANGYAQLSINFVRTMDEEKSQPGEQLDFKEFE